MLLNPPHCCYSIPVCRIYCPVVHGFDIEIFRVSLQQYNSVLHLEGFSYVMLLCNPKVLRAISILYTIIIITSFL